MLRRPIILSPTRIRELTEGFTPEQAGHFTNALGAEYGNVAAEHLTALRRSAGRKSVQSLVEVLGDEQEEVRIKAMQLLVSLWATETIPKIEHNLLDREYRVRQVATESLGLLTAHKNNDVFIELEKLSGKEMHRGGYTIHFKDSHQFPDKHIYSGPMLELRVLGRPVCLLGYRGTAIVFIQGIKNEQMAKTYIPRIGEEFLKLMKPIIERNNGVYVNQNNANSPGTQGIEKRFFKAGKLAVSPKLRKLLKMS